MSNKLAVKNFLYLIMLAFFFLIGSSVRRHSFCIYLFLPFAFGFTFIANKINKGFYRIIFFDLGILFCSLYFITKNEILIDIGVFFMILFAPHRDRLSFSNKNN